MTSFLYDWQTLVGSIIGAASAFFVWMVAESYRRISERKERLISVEKFLGLYAILMADTYKAIVDFMEGRFKNLLQNTSKNISGGSYYIGQTFFPVLSLDPLDGNLIGLHTGSGYVDSKLLFVIKRSRDFRDMIDDIKRQFEVTLQNNRELVLQKSNSPQVQSQQFYEHLQQFGAVIKKEILENNIPICIKEVVEAQVSVRELAKQYLWRWKLRFGPSFKCFCKKKQVDSYFKKTHSRIDLYLKEKFIERFKEVNTQFKPQLKVPSFNQI